MNVSNNMIVNNVSTHEGGGVALDDAPEVRLVNNTIMKNLTTATAVTSNGQPAPAGLFDRRSTASSCRRPSRPGAPTFSNPVLFNNIFWDNRAGTRTGDTVTGLGVAGDATPDQPLGPRHGRRLGPAHARPTRCSRRPPAPWRARPTAPTDPNVEDDLRRLGGLRRLADQPAGSSAAILVAVGPAAEPARRLPPEEQHLAGLQPAAPRARPSAPAPARSRADGRLRPATHGPPSAPSTPAPTRSPAARRTSRSRPSRTTGPGQPGQARSSTRSRSPTSARPTSRRPRSPEPARAPRGLAASGTWTCTATGGSCGAASGSGSHRHHGDASSRRARRPSRSPARSRPSAATRAAAGRFAYTRDRRPPRPAPPTRSPANNSATDSRRSIVAASADLAITKSDGVTAAASATVLTYTIAVTNTGPATATGATRQRRRPRPA